MITDQQQQIVTVTLAMRVYRAAPDVYCIRNRAEHTTLCALEKRGLVAYAGDAVPDNGLSTWTATEALQDRIAALVAGDDGADAEPDDSATKPAPQPVTVTLDDIDWGNLEELSKHLNYSTELHSIVTRLDKLVDCGYADKINKRYWITANGRTALADHNAILRSNAAAMDGRLTSSVTPSTTFTVEQELRFTVGDQVIVSNPMKGAKPWNGSLGKVASLKDQIYANARNCDYLVEFDNSVYVGFFDSELSPAPPPITVQLAHPFAVGTRIRVKAGYRDWLRSKPGSVVIDNYEANDLDRLSVTAYNGDADWYICTSDGMDVLFVPTEWVELE